jgi:hypothetical protein
MAKYGLFSAEGNKLQDYEGDFIQQDKQFVYIFERAKSANTTSQQVAAIHLDAGQSVKKITD